MARGQKAPMFAGVRDRLVFVREHRGLNAAELGRKANLSRTAVANIEDGRTAPGIDTVERLANALGVSAAWLGFGDAALIELTNYMVAPGFDPMKLSTDLAALVNGAGGHIDQMFLYLDPLGAANWRSLTDTYHGLPSRPLAEAIAKHAGRKPIDIVGLGVGLGQHEVALAKQLLSEGADAMRLYLLDISHPLLTAASQLAQESLQDTDVRTIAIEGDFYRLPSFMHYLGGDETGPRLRVATMFGYTFSNLGNEVLFVRDSLVGFLPGDLLVLDVVRAYAPADQPAQIRNKDPVLKGKRPAEFQSKIDAFLTGPIRKYRNESGEISVAPFIDTTSCPVPGSYGIDQRVTVRTASRAPCQFTVGHAKRYDIDKLADCLKQEGWEMLEHWPYGEEFPGALCLFQRTPHVR